MGKNKSKSRAKQTPPNAAATTSKAQPPPPTAKITPPSTSATASAPPPQIQKQTPSIDFTTITPPLPQKTQPLAAIATNPPPPPKNKPSTQTATAKAPQHGHHPQPTKQQQTGTWADKIRVSGLANRTQLGEYKLVRDGDTTWIPREALFEDSVWERSLIGYFPGQGLPFHAVRIAATKAWKSLGLQDIRTVAKSFFLFRFRSEEEARQIEETGPWMFGSRYMVVQKWTPNFAFDMSRITKTPIWARLHGLPFSMWTNMGLSMAAANVGKPLSCDRMTSELSRLDYARVCVEWDAATTLPSEFKLRSETFSVTVRVEYEWRPKRCSKCCVFGHVCHDTLQAGKDAAKPSKAADKGKRPMEDALTGKPPMVSHTDTPSTKASGSSPPPDAHDSRMVAYEGAEPLREGVPTTTGRTISPPHSEAKNPDHQLIVYKGAGPAGEGISNSTSRQLGREITAVESDSEGSEGSDSDSLLAIEVAQDIISGHTPCEFNREMSPFSGSSSARSPPSDARAPNPPGQQSLDTQIVAVAESPLDVRHPSPPPSTKGGKGKT